MNGVVCRLLLCVALGTCVARAVGDTPTCGGSCTPGTLPASPLCIFATPAAVGVNVISGGCSGETLRLQVTAPGFGQSGIVLVRSMVPNFVFEDIIVEVFPTGGAISLSVIPHPLVPIASIASIRDVYEIGGDGSPGELWISQIVAGSVRSVSAVRVNEVRATTGDITGAITATGSGAPQAQPGVIGTIQATSGKILGNISSTGSITTVQASSDIGTSATPVSITWGNNAALSTTSLGTVQGANIYANITAASPISGTRGNVTKVRSTSGTFSGACPPSDSWPMRAIPCPVFRPSVAWQQA